MHEAHYSATGVILRAFEPGGCTGAIEQSGWASYNSGSVAH